MRLDPASRHGHCQRSLPRCSCAVQHYGSAIFAYHRVSRGDPCSNSLHWRSSQIVHRCAVLTWWRRAHATADGGPRASVEQSVDEPRGSNRSSFRSVCQIEGGSYRRQSRTRPSRSSIIGRRWVAASIHSYNARAVWSICTDNTHRRETASCACTQKQRRSRTSHVTCMCMNPYCHMYRCVLHTIAVGCDAATRRRIRAQQRSGSSVAACPCMDRRFPRASFTCARSHVNRSYSRSVRALVDIQDIRYPTGLISRRAGRMPNGYPRFRLGNVELPSSPDTDSDSDETLRHKTRHRVLGLQVIRRLQRNMWAKQNFRRLLYFLCWVFKGKHVAHDTLTDIARYIGKWAVIENATAVQRTVFAPPFREWQSRIVRELERRYGPYPLRTRSRPS